MLIPPAIHSELSRNPRAAARGLLEYAIKSGWIQVSAFKNVVPQELARNLDLGEAEALGLAVETKAEIVLLDETAARLRAAALGLRVTGALGILRKARNGGRVDSLKTEMERLRVEARFFIDPMLEKALLVSVGED